MKLIFAAGLLASALLAIIVTPTNSSPVANPTAVAVAEPSGGDLLDLDVLLAVDLSGLGDLLNALLGLILGLLGAQKCEYKDYGDKIEGLLVDLNVYINLLGIKVKVNLLILLGPLLEAVTALLKGLLKGVLVNVSVVINLCLNILVKLNLELDIEVALKLGNLLNLDVLALLKLG